MAHFLAVIIGGVSAGTNRHPLEKLRRRNFSREATKRPWYQSKRGPSFADMLATLRSESIQNQVLKPMHLGKDPVKTLIHVVKLAA
jgi:hypothetical protein